MAYRKRVADLENSMSEKEEEMARLEQHVTDLAKEV